MVIFHSYVKLPEGKTTTSLGPLQKKGAPIEPKFDVELLDPMSGSPHAWLHDDTNIALGLVLEDSGNPDQAQSQQSEEDTWFLGKLCQIGYHKIGWLHLNRRILKYPPVSDQVQPG